MAGKHNLVCNQGATFNFQFVIKNDDTAWDLSGYTGTMTVRPFIGSTSTTTVASTANGKMTFEPLNGRVIVEIESTETANFSATRHVYDLILDSGSTVTRMLEGKFVVVPGVTV